MKRLIKLLLVSLASFVLLNSNPSLAQAPANNPDTWKENYAYALGLQAYVFGYPYINFASLRWAFVAKPPPNAMTPYAPVNHFFHFRKLADASYTGGGGTNNDTVYSTAWIDLSKEPVILSHADMGNRYFYFQLASFDSDNFGAVGTRTTGSKAASFALIGPNWNGELPKGIKASFRSRTNHGFILCRTLIDRNDADVKVVNRLQDQFTLVPLSLSGKPDAALPASRDVWKPFDRKTDPLADWKTMNRALAENPPEARLAPLLKMFAEIGVGPGLDVEAQDETVKRGLARAAVDGRQMLFDINNSSHPFLWKSKNGWDISPPHYGRLGLEDDFLRRAAITLSGVMSPESEEASYYQSNSDAAGALFDGSKAYNLTFPPGTLPDVRAFWSLTMYSTNANKDFNLVPNPIGRYSIGDRTPGVVRNKDGGLTLYIQSNSPGRGKETNWLPSPKEGQFTLTFRTYVPGKEIVEQRWFPPAVQPINTK